MVSGPYARGLSSTFTPGVGRRVPRLRMSIRCPGTRLTSNRCATMARINTASSLAKDSPMQKRGPPLKGM